MRWIGLGAGAWLAALLPSISAQAATAREYQIKAAFVFNFAQFVQWRAGTFADDRVPIVIGVLGRDPFEGELDRAVAGKTAGGRPLVVRHFPRGADVQQPCHMLFAGTAAEDEFLAARRRLGDGASLLSVGEADRFLPDGGIIHLYEADNRLRFEINQEAAARAGLRISAKLLRLARPQDG